MHKVMSPAPLEEVVYKVKGDGIADVWLRNHQEEITLEDGSVEYQADEVFFRVSAEAVSQNEIEEDFDFWCLQLEEREEGADAGDLAAKVYIANRRAEISAECRQIIYNGVSVVLYGDSQHFSLTEVDQLNLFGKQTQLAAGVERLEYHEDGQPCRYYTAEEMQQIIRAAMAHVTYHTTYCNSLFQWLASKTKASEAQQIFYGADIPEEYQSEVLKDLLKEIMGEVSE